ncbi:MAG: hypothetical protein IID54_04365, partial [Proteobacteria bacterium]|nr:hypothetical protein [Pseudomonadota bacterium]
MSVVATSRNDDHGGDMLQRMQHFVDGFIAQCRRHNISAELILIEWNPPADRPPLAEALRCPDDLGPCEIRIITVPREIHARFEHAESLPLFQMIAKNVGIRRARGAYVLATNVDILFNDKLFVYMRDRLRPRRLVRVDRFDVPTSVPTGVPFDRILEYCNKNFYRISTKFGILDIIDERPARQYGNTVLALTSLWYRLRIPRLRPKLVKRPLRSVWSSLRALSGAAALRALGAAAARCRTAFSRLGYRASKIFPLSRLPSRVYWPFYRVARAAM